MRRWPSATSASTAPRGLVARAARRVALAVQEALESPDVGRSTATAAARCAPLGSNATAQGRALNRRVEVEFWYDDPLQELPDEPQLCPAPGNEIVTRVYDPPWGALPQLAIENGAAVVPAGLRGHAAPRARRRRRQDERAVALRRLHAQRTARAAHDARLRRRHRALGRARAPRDGDDRADMQLAAEQLEFEGRGYVHSDDVVNAGFVQGETSHVVVQVVYDEVAELDDYDGVDITPLTRELEPQNAFGLNLMRITVDGEPIDDPGRSSADIQRCTDVALKQADIQFGFDNLEADRRLAVAAEPATVSSARQRRRLAACGARAFHDVRELLALHRARRGADLRARAVARGRAARRRRVRRPTAPASGCPSRGSFATPARELKYVLRAYGKGGSVRRDGAAAALARVRDEARHASARSSAADERDAVEAFDLAELDDAGARRASRQRERDGAPR